MVTRSRLTLPQREALRRFSAGSVFIVFPGAEGGPRAWESLTSWELPGGTRAREKERPERATLTALATAGFITPERRVRALGDVIHRAHVYRLSDEEIARTRCLQCEDCGRPIKGNTGRAYELAGPGEEPPILCGACRQAAADAAEVST